MTEKWKVWFKENLFIPVQGEDDSSPTPPKENVWPKEVQKIESKYFGDKRGSWSMGKSCISIEKIKEKSIDIGVYALLFLHPQNKEYQNFLALKFSKSFSSLKKESTYNFAPSIGNRIFPNAYLFIGAQYPLQGSKKDIKMMVGINYIFDVFLLGIGKLLLLGP